jgi:hypothetical protein
MKYALISPEEKVYNNGSVVGFRVADIQTEKFDIAAPLFWVECTNNVDVNHYYDESEQDFYEIPVNEITVYQPTLEELQAQLNLISQQIASLSNTA